MTWFDFCKVPFEIERGLVLVSFNFVGTKQPTKCPLSET